LASVPGAGAAVRHRKACRQLRALWGHRTICAKSYAGRPTRRLHPVGQLSFAARHRGDGVAPKAAIRSRFRASGGLLVPSSAFPQHANSFAPITRAATLRYLRSRRTAAWARLPLTNRKPWFWAHAIATDPSNRFAFLPHIPRIQDDVLEPPQKNPGPNLGLAVPL